VAGNDLPEMPSRSPVAIWGVNDFPADFCGGYCGTNKRRPEPLVEQNAKEEKRSDR